MTTITKADITHAAILAHIGKKTFIESHGMSAPEKDINEFVRMKFNEAAILKELNSPGALFYIIYVNGNPAGYSKIVLNAVHSKVPLPDITKLERIFLLQQHYGTSIGKELFNFILRLSKMFNQSGMWLYVWTENKRAINFYKKNGFEIIDDYNYKISDTHSNPNYCMFLKY